MNDVSVISAFIAGILSFLSPCVLPMIPAYLAYISNSKSLEILKHEETKQEINKMKTQVIYNAIIFCLGFTIVFVMLGALATGVGKQLDSHRDIISKVAGIFIVLMGINLTGLLNIKSFNKEKRFIKPKENIQYIGAFFLGLAFAFAWTPCVGPILTSILYYASNLDTVTMGIILLLSYSLGLAIPFLLCAVFIEYGMAFIKKAKKILPYMAVINGVIVIAFGLLILFDKLEKIIGIIS